MTYEKRRTHKRWLTLTQRSQASSDPDAKHCAACHHYQRIVGWPGREWGVCANTASTWNATLRNQGDGCDGFDPSIPVSHLVKQNWSQETPRSDAANDEPWHNQCFVCRHYRVLSGSTGADWGVCSNSQSQWDALLRFEHDGCTFFEQEHE